MDAETEVYRYLAAALAPGGCTVARAAPADLKGSLPVVVIERRGGSSDGVTDRALMEAQAWDATQKGCRALAHRVAALLDEADEGVARVVGASVTSLVRDDDTDARLPMWRCVCNIDYQGDEA